MTSRLLPSAALLAMLPLSSALAGGFQTLPASAPALGLGGAMTAMARDASTAWFNPGAMGMLDSASASIGLTALRTGRVFRSFTTDQTTKANAALLPAPNFYIAFPFQITVGRSRAKVLEAKLKGISQIERVVAIIRGADNVDSASVKLQKEFNLSEKQARAILKLRLRGLTQIDETTVQQEYDRVFADSTRTIVFGLSVNSPFGYDTKWPSNWQGRSLVRESRVRTLYAQPTVAYRVSNRFSIGGGVDLVGADYKFDHAIGEFDGAAATYEASGKGIGFNLGIYGRAGDAIAFGITYRSAVKVKMTNGSATFTGIPSSQAARFPAAVDFNTTLQLPSQLSAGISNHLTDRLLLNFTFELTGWSVLDSTNIVFANNARTTERLGRRYEDAMTFRVGSEYQYSDALALRVGLYYDESPVRDQNITADLPDANMLGGSVGIGYRLGRHLSFDAAYTYGISASRNARANAANVIDVPAIGGVFRNNQHGAAFNLNYHF